VTYDHPYWAGYLAASVATAITNIHDGHEPADIAVGLRRDLTAYLRSAAGKPIKQLLEDRMNGNDNETTSNETDTTETSVR
jgi:hypothetical protein